MTSPLLDAPPTTTRLERRKARTRAAILDSARKLFMEQGFEATSIAQIAEAADSGVGTLYGYFSNKEEILNEVLRTHGALAARGVQDGIKEDSNSLERLINALNGFSMYLEEYRVLLLSAFQINAKRLATDETPASWLSRIFEGLITDGIARGEIRDVPAQPTARTLVSAYIFATLGVVHWHDAINDPRTRTDLEAMVRALLTP